MVTLGSLLSFLCLFSLIIFIDADIYEVSFFTALSIMFDSPMGLGRTVLYIFAMIGLIAAIVNDVRRKKAS